MMVGPDYRRPAPSVAGDWITRGGAGIAPGSEPIGPWWDSFNDPILSQLIMEAYQGNPSLRAAGVRVIEAQARRGIAIGTLFPQIQNAVASYSRNVASENVPFVPPQRGFNDFLTAFDVGWELDFWGKFRRGIESADATLLASIANYDDVLVSLLAEVALNYIGIRTAQKELGVAQRNAQIQREGFDIATRRAQAGEVTQVDPAQAATLLHSTEAQIPTFEAQIDQQAAGIGRPSGNRPSWWQSPMLLGKG
jgi:outer membrane protein TolC